MARRQRDKQRKLQEKRNDIRQAIGAKVVCVCDCVCAFGLWRSSSRCDSLVVVAEEKNQIWAR